MSPERSLATDVVVVGGGACGMAAAVAARQQGAEVVLLEKGRDPGGNTALSTGSVPGAGTRFQEAAGIEDSPELMAEDIMRQANHQSDRDLVLRLCDESRRLVDWLVDDLGVELYLVTDYKHVGHSVHRLH
ncbi:MAG: FAD-dependent oxidoreductase, partial [Rubrobacter sp.]